MAFYEFNPDDAIRFADFVHIKARRTGDELVFHHCPFCGEHSNDKNKFAINLKTGQYNCFRATCGAHGNMITLSKYFGFELPGYADEYYNARKRYARLPQKDRPQTTEPAIEYLRSRGISEATARKYEITTDKQRPELLIFPFYDENNVLQLVKYRNTLATKENGLDKEWSLRDKKNDLSCKPILFGMNHCDPAASDTLIMTEGQLDTLAVAEAGYQNVVSVPTGANGFTWVPYCWNFMRQFKNLIVFGDYEKGHITLLREMQHHFFFGKILHVKPENYKDCKDANDILQKYGPEQIRKCIDDAAQIVNEKFVKLSEIRPRPIAEMESFKTGIESLDRILGGMYFGQLVILTGERGEGKSTISNQLALMAVNSEIKTFIYSGELPDGTLRDWIDCQAAGPAHMIEHRNSFGDADYTIEEGISDKIGEWYSENLYIFQNKQLEDLDSEEEDEEIIDLIKEATAEGFRMIVIDNLMTAMDDDPRYDLYRAQTKFVKQLSRITKARDVLIVLIAHQRKNQGTMRTADDVSGSGNITNLADVVLMFGKPKDKEATWPRELTVLKNRLTGKLGSPIPIWYDEGSRRTNDTQRFDWALGWEQDFTEIGEVPNPFEGVEWDDEE